MHILNYKVMSVLKKLLKMHLYGYKIDKLKYYLTEYFVKFFHRSSLLFDIYLSLGNWYSTAIGSVQYNIFDAITC